MININILLAFVHYSHIPNSSIGRNNSIGSGWKTKKCNNSIGRNNSIGWKTTKFNSSMRNDSIVWKMTRI